MAIIDIIQATEKNERDAAFQIRETVFVNEQKIDFALEFDGLDDRAEHLLAKIDNATVGTLRLRYPDDNIAKIERVAVLKEARGQSVGAALVSAAIDRLREQHISQAKLHAQTYAINFYTKLGFIAHGDVFDEDGIPHQAMTRNLHQES